MGVRKALYLETQAIPEPLPASSDFLIEPVRVQDGQIGVAHGVGANFHERMPSQPDQLLGIEDRYG
jgi:hypothetical protein